MHSGLQDMHLIEATCFFGWRNMEAVNALLELGLFETIDQDKMGVQVLENVDLHDKLAIAHGKLIKTVLPDAILREYRLNPKKVGDVTVYDQHYFEIEYGEYILNIKSWWAFVWLKKSPDQMMLGLPLNGKKTPRVIDLQRGSIDKPLFVKKSWIVRMHGILREIHPVFNSAEFLMEVK